ncbi:hypothetical protein [Desulforhopalus singaporensis]|uniref:Hpr(Ser) kinase/phosphatase n=1 Tax=Desulforhopalus singaporensis TaxID=91360 RepID=A0A1H0VK24_9BACT|nr:hypothetical protein [Desulforhopalus singaporensis]SDP78693.1 hypothetical protein SAMN05660330_04109 [Desulforhopalus singaporensis]
MTKQQISSFVRLADAEVEISYSAAHEALVNFLFCDHITHPGQVCDNKLQLYLDYSEGLHRLFDNTNSLYQGKCWFELASTLMSKVIHYCINDSSHYLSIHAAAFDIEGRGVLFPGKSGSGKSSLAAWLTLQGYHYFTDELVMLSKNGEMHPLTRPISINKSSWPLLSPHATRIQNGVVAGQRGFMVAHRNLNSQWEKRDVTLNTIVFPQYQPTERAVFEPISQGQAFFRLLENYIKARDFHEFSISELASLVRGVETFRLCYSKLEELDEILEPFFVHA